MKKITLTFVVLISLLGMASCNDDNGNIPTPEENTPANNDSVESDSMYISPNSEQNAGMDTLSFDASKVKAIDLGISVRWASLNIGATYTESMGTKFTWREVPNDQEDYKNQTDYKYYESMKIARNDDTAKALWGGSWRMPTESEFLELRDECTWSKVDEHPNLLKITGPNGNYIYFPVYETWRDLLGNNSYYGGTIYTSDVNVQNFGDGYVEFYPICYSYSAAKWKLGMPGWEFRCPVRPVMPL